MNCDEFARVMHQRLDDRSSLERDDKLLRHADQCDSCRIQLEAWRQIATVLPDPHRLAEAGVETQAASLNRAIGPATAGHPHGTASPINEPFGGQPTATGTMASHAFVGAIAAVAVAVLLVVVLAPDDSTVEPVAVVESNEVPRETALAQSGDQLDPSLWWRDVQNRDWVGQTMPTVKSVQEGVAPIGRSLMRAVTILTLGGKDQTS